VQLDTIAEDRTAVRSALAVMCATAQRGCAARHGPPFSRSRADEGSEKRSARRTECPPGRSTRAA